MNQKEKDWYRKYPLGKAPLSWDVDDYKHWNEEPPECVKMGITEGQSAGPDEVETWSRETVRILSVIREEYPDRFKKVLADYRLDLEYLNKLGKITNEEKKLLSKEELFDFGK